MMFIIKAYVTEKYTMIVLRLQILEEKSGRKDHGRYRKFLLSDPPEDSEILVHGFNK